MATDSRREGDDFVTDDRTTAHGNAVRTCVNVRTSVRACLHMHMRGRVDMDMAMDMVG